MHYRNGVEAKQGDKVLNLQTGQIGFVYNLQPQATSCNGRLAPLGQSDPYVTLSDLVLVEDVEAAFPRQS